MVNINRTLEHYPTKLSHGVVEVQTKHKEKKGGRWQVETKTETIEGFSATSQLVARDGESKEIIELYYTFRETGDQNSLYRIIDIKIEALAKKAEDGVALTDDEVKEIRDLISWCPGGKGLEQEQLTKQLQRTIGGQLEGIKDNSDAKILEQAEAWDKLRLRDLAGVGLSSGSKKPATINQEAKAIEESEKYNLVTDLYFYCQAHGASPQTLRLSDFLRKRLTDDKRGKTLHKLIQGEVKRDREDLNRPYQQSNLEKNIEMVVNPVEYWNNELLRAVKTRLVAMRAPIAARLEVEKDKKGKESQKMEINYREKRPNKFNSSLVLEVVDDRTELGKFLDEMSVGAYWRGKACLDVAYHVMYKGWLMSVSEDLPDQDRDIFRIRDEYSANLRKYTGNVAMRNMGEDQRFNDAQLILYQIYPGLTFKDKLQILADKYKFNPDGELPDYVTDAVMYEKVAVLDAFNMSRADLRCLDYHPAQYFDLELVTDARGGVMQFLGKNMRFTEDGEMKMGWFNAKNLRFNYEAMVPDKRGFNPEEYWDQKDKTWQHLDMYLLELNDRDHSLVRKITEEGEVITIKGKPMTATPGQSGEYQNYMNDRFNETTGIYEHRRGVYDRIKNMGIMDAQLVRERKFGKAGWDEALYKDIEGKEVIVRKAVEQFVSFCSQAVNITIGDVKIEKGVDEIFYNDELAVLLNDFEADPNNPAFAQHKNDLVGFLNMRNVLRDYNRTWGFVFDLNDPEVQARLFNNQDLTFAERYDLAANKSRGILFKELCRSTAIDDIYAMKGTPGKILEAITEFGQRRHVTQNYWPMFRLIEFTEAAMMRRLTEMEIASAKDLLQMVDPMGEVQLGAGEKVRKMLGVVDDMWGVWKSIIGEIENIGYLEELTWSRLELQKRSLLGNWRDAIRAHAERELAAEAFNWGLTRTLPLEQQAGIDDELAAGWQFVGGDRESGSMFPVQTWQVPDVVIHSHEIKREPLSIQGINRVQEFQYFRRLELQEAGNVFGGARKAKVVLGKGGYFLTGPKEYKTRKEVTDFVEGQEKEALILQEYQDDQAKTWLRLGVEKDSKVIEAGWIQKESINILGYVGQQFDEPLRPGEIRREGGRLFWRYYKENEGPGQAEGWRWTWVTGQWVPDQTREELGFIPGVGIEPKLQVGTKDSIKTLEDEMVVYDKAVVKARKTGKSLPPPLLFDRNTLAEVFLQTTNTKTGTLNPANYPFMVFKSEEARRKFYLGRGRMLFSLRLGSVVGTTLGGQSEAGLPGWMYRNETGALGQVTKFGYEMLKLMRLQVRVAIYRGGLAVELERHFGKVYLPDEIIAKLKKTYEKAMTGEQWGEDFEVMRKLISETPFWAVLRNKEFKIKERPGKALSIGLRGLTNGLLKGVGGFLKARLPFDFAPLNVPTVIATVFALGGFGWIEGAGFARSAGIILGTGTATSYILGMIGVGLMRKIKPDLSRLKVFSLPGIKNFHEWIPVE